MHRMRMLIAVAPLAAFLSACSSDSSPTAAGTGNAIASAHVLVGGAPVEGTVVTGDRGATRLQVMMRDRDQAHLRDVARIQVHYSSPGAGQGMMRRSGVALCYDDGTHGDDRAGDGIFHRMDADDDWGCGRAGMTPGSYEYRFDCQMLDGRSCGDVVLTVTRP